MIDHRSKRKEEQIVGVRAKTVQTVLPVLNRLRQAGITDGKNVCFMAQQYSKAASVEEGRRMLIQNLYMLENAYEPEDGEYTALEEVIECLQSLLQ